MLEGHGDAGCHARPAKLYAATISRGESGRRTIQRERYSCSVAVDPNRLDRHPDIGSDIPRLEEGFANDAGILELMNGGWRKAQCTPRLGEAFLISAMIAGERLKRAFRKSRR